jgi:tRNA A-37 threonylcarbamoyl transferase component Bud32
MDTARFLRLRAIFDHAVGLPAGEQAAYLDRECAGDPELRAEVQALWEAYLGQTPAAASPAPPGSEQSIGPYRLHGRIGEGGMGSVYLAVRDDGAFRKQVALKVLRRDAVSEDLIRRFHQERQVLANLDHPNIARIVDGGQTPDGLPYYVMDYVEGVPLDRFCDERKLDLAGRVRLFQQLCYAVHYLHENLVVHRDLKPSNILVTAEGTLKLLDFGIAKLQLPAAAEMTSPYNRLMTPAYASPEQFSGAPITRASDLYSLGVILYQLLTGALPFADPGAKLHVDPPPPSRSIREDINRTPETTAQLRRRIVGDLDHIVLMCMHRDPHRRYNSASELAEDLQRFLEGRTVAARPVHVTERVMKFVKRNRLAVAACMLLVLLAVFGAWQALEAQIQTRRVVAKETEIARLLDTLNKNNTQNALPAARVEGARQIRQALQRDLPAGSPEAAAATPERHELLRRALEYLDSLRPFAIGDPALANELAQSYQALGALAQAHFPDLALTAFQHGAAILAALGEAAPQTARPPEQSPPAVRSAGAQLPRSAAPVTEAAPPTDAPQEIAPPVPAVDPKVRQAVESRLMDVTAKSQTADEVLEQLRASSQKLNQMVHPDITRAYNRMKLELAAGQRDFENGSFDSAREHLDIADALAAKVLKAGGR